MTDASKARQPHRTPRQKALRELRLAVDEIAAMNPYPPPPRHYDVIQKRWRRVSKVARRAKRRVDALLGPESEEF